MALFPYDAFDIISLLVGDEPGVSVLDVGANVGEVAARLAAVLPRADVYAFEPDPATFASLESAAAAEPRIHARRLAVGDRAGRVTLQVMSDHRYSSVLPLTQTSLRQYEGSVTPSGRLEVPMVRLDHWAGTEGVGRPLAIKVDVQGLELDVLRGAEGLLPGVLAINAEAQLVPQYEGAATYADIDLFLRARGFSLYQIHEVWPLGPERQHVCLDALWLSAAGLERLRAMIGPDATVDRLVRVRRALLRLRGRGVRRAAVYGAGRHTASVIPVLRAAPLDIACVLDDRAQPGASVGPWPVVRPADARRLGVDGVLLSSDLHEPTLWSASAPFRDAGLPVERLYDDALAAPHP